MLLRLDSISTDIKEGKFTFEEAAGAISDDKDTRNNYGIMYNRNTASAQFSFEELPADVARVVENLEVGELSQPFAWILDNGKTVCAIAKLRSRTEAHLATINDDYETLSMMYKSELGNQRLQDWIKQKQQNTYVRINSDSRNCEFKYPHWEFYEEAK
jgi:peptidyl-prolyl cis-trans isomerase SurA